MTRVRYTISNALYALPKKTHAYCMYFNESPTKKISGNFSAVKDPHKYQENVEIFKAIINEMNRKVLAPIFGAIVYSVYHLSK